MVETTKLIPGLLTRRQAISTRSACAFDPDYDVFPRLVVSGRAGVRKRGHPHLCSIRTLGLWGEPPMFPQGIQDRPPYGLNCHAPHVAVCSRNLNPALFPCFRFARSIRYCKGISDPLEPLPTPPAPRTPPQKRDARPSLPQNIRTTASSNSAPSLLPGFLASGGDPGADGVPVPRVRWDPRGRPHRRAGLPFRRREHHHQRSLPGRVAAAGRLVEYRG